MPFQLWEKPSLSGDLDEFVFVDNFFRFPLVAVVFPALFVPVGAIFFSIGIWRSRALPRLSGVLYAVTSFLVAFPLPIHILRLIAGVIGVLVGVWIAASVKPQPAPQMEIE